MPPKPVIGIDPGFKGAIAVYWPSSGIIDLCDMPVTKATGRETLHLGAVWEALRMPADEPVTVWLERVSPRPGEGVVSSFRFGQGFGSLEAMAVAHGHELRHVTPQTWKRHYGLIGDATTTTSLAKAASRNRAKGLWPDQADLFRRVKDHGRAEAALIARYGWEMSLVEAA